MVSMRNKKKYPSISIKYSLLSRALGERVSTREAKNIVEVVSLVKMVADSIRQKQNPVLSTYTNVLLGSVSLGGCLVMIIVGVKILVVSASVSVGMHSSSSTLTQSGPCPDAKMMSSLPFCLGVVP